MPPPHSPDRGRDIDRSRQTWQDPRTLPYNNNTHDGRPLPPSGNSGPSGSVWGQPSNPYFSNSGAAGSSSRRSRSPEGDRMRAGGRGNYRSVDNYYPQSEHGEPGQILPPCLSHNPISIPFSIASNNTLPRDPRASASVPTGPSSYRPIPNPNHPQPTQYRPRKPSSDRPNDGGRSPLPGGSSSTSGRDTLAPSSGSVMNALESFSKAMHSALITTSQHALAFKHFSRLSTSNVVNQHSPTYEEAEKRVSKAQKVVDEQMIALQSSFTELIRRTIGTTSTSSDAISALELDALKERMRKIEDITSKASRSLVPPPPPSIEVPPPPPPPPVSAAAENEDGGPPSRPPTPSFPPPTTSSSTSNRPITTEEKKRRVKDVLDDIITRLEKVEDIKNEFDSRIDEIETVQMTNEEEYMDRESRRAQMRKYSGWGGLESRRDPQGLIRGLKRKERENDDAVQDRQASPAAAGERAVTEGDEDVIMGGNSGPGGYLVEDLQKDVERLSEEIKTLKTQLASKSPIKLFPLLAGPTAAALEQITNQLNSQTQALTGLTSSSQISSEAPPLLTTTPLSPTTSLGNMMNQLNSQRQALASQSTGQMDSKQVNELKSEMVKLSQQMAALQSIAQNTTKSDGIPTSTTIDGVQPQSASQSELLNLQNTINSIQSVIDKFSTDIQTLLSDKASRLGIFEKIQIGVSSLAESIQKCRNDYTHLNDLSRASSATILLHTESLKVVSGDLELIKIGIKSIRQQQSGSGTVGDKDKEILELRANIAELKQDIKDLREGREEWTKEIMKACLHSVKEENESRKEDYAKIARREIQNTVRDFMTKRSALSSTTSTSGGPTSTSSGLQAQSQLNRSISEPTDNTNTNNNLTNSISPSIQPPINPSPAIQPNLLPPGIPHQNNTPSPLSQNTHLRNNSNAQQAQGQGSTANPLAARIQTISPQPVVAPSKPTLSDRMNTTSATVVVQNGQHKTQPQPHVSHPLRDRLTGSNPNEQNGGGDGPNDLDIDRS